MSFFNNAIQLPEPTADMEGDRIAGADGVSDSHAPAAATPSAPASASGVGTPPPPAAAGGSLAGDRVTTADGGAKNDVSDVLSETRFEHLQESEYDPVSEWLLELEVPMVADHISNSLAAVPQPISEHLTAWVQAQRLTPSIIGVAVLRELARQKEQGNVLVQKSLADQVARGRQPLSTERLRDNQRVVEKFHHLSALYEQGRAHDAMLDLPGLSIETEFGPRQSRFSAKERRDAAMLGLLLGVSKLKQKQEDGGSDGQQENQGGGGSRSRNTTYDTVPSSVGSVGVAQNLHASGGPAPTANAAPSGVARPKAGRAPARPAAANFTPQQIRQAAALIAHVMPKSKTAVNWVDSVTPHVATTPGFRI